MNITPLCIARKPTYRFPCHAHQDHDTKHTVFVGGLPFKVEDELLWEHFSQCGEVVSVRAIRDKKTQIGKGIAYVRFKVCHVMSETRTFHDEPVRYIRYAFGINLDSSCEEWSAGVS